MERSRVQVKADELKLTFPIAETNWGLSSVYTFICGLGRYVHSYVHLLVHVLLSTVVLPKKSFWSAGTAWLI